MSLRISFKEIFVEHKFFLVEIVCTHTGSEIECVKNIFGRFECLEINELNQYIAFTLFIQKSFLSISENPYVCRHNFVDKKLHNIIFTAKINIQIIDWFIGKQRSDCSACQNTLITFEKFVLLFSDICF